MQMDLQAMFSDAQAVTAGTQFSSLCVDLVPTTLGANGYAPEADFGAGTPKEILVQVVEAFTGGTSLAVDLVMADNDLLTTNMVVLASTDAVVEASLVPGYQFGLRYVPDNITKRYIGLRYRSTGTHGTGKVTAGFVLGRSRAA